MAIAVWHIVRVMAKAVFIIDENLPGTKSVTNDAEAVTDELLKTYGGKRRLFYLDSMGHWDELVHNGQRFVGFAPGLDGFKPPKEIS